LPSNTGAGRLNAGRSQATVNRDLVALLGAFTKAVEWENVTKLTANPFDAVELADVDTAGRVRYLSAAEEQRLRAAFAARDAKRRAGREQGNAWRRERKYPERDATAPTPIT